MIWGEAAYLPLQNIGSGLPFSNRSKIRVIFLTDVPALNYLSFFSA